MMFLTHTELLVRKVRTTVLVVTVMIKKIKVTIPLASYIYILN
jgi:hypothetical protein